MPVPLVIDTTEPDVLEAALKTAPGRCMLNSTHLESGRPKADKIFSLVKAHNATVMVLTIDEDGMAKTAERKLSVAQRIYDIAVNEHGLKPGDLIFDALTFTLATGDPEFANAAVETIEGYPADQGCPARCFHFFRRQQSFLWIKPPCPSCAQQCFPVSLCAGGFGYGNYQPGPYHALCKYP